MLQDEFWKQQADICPQRKLQYQWFTYTAAKVKKIGEDMVLFDRYSQPGL